MTALVLASLCLLAAVGSASAVDSSHLIRINASLGGVEFHASKAAVDRRLGTPRCRRELSETVCAYRSGVVVRYSEVEHQASIIGTASPRFRTASGIGPGSTLARFKSAYPRAVPVGGGWFQLPVTQAHNPYVKNCVGPITEVKLTHGIARLVRINTTTFCE